jgi:hypothetical protein
MGIGSYGLGDRYISPDRRLSKVLLEGNTRKGKPAYHWSDTLGRIAQQLAGGYLAGRDRNNQDVANRAFTGVQPDVTRQPTEAEALKQSSELWDLEDAAKTNVALDGLGQNVMAPNTDEQLMQQGEIPEIMKRIGQFNQQMGPEGATGNEGLKEGLDVESKFFNDEMNRAREASIQSRPRDFQEELAQGIQAYQRDDANQIQEKKMPQSEYSMQELRKLTDNPYAQRLLQGLMMQSADRDYTSGLAETARTQKLADIKSGRDFKSKENQLNRQAKINAAEVGLGTGPLQGKTLPIQNRNILMNGDPSSANYLRAYIDLSQPKTTFDPETGRMISVSPDMSAYRKPTDSSISNAPQGQTLGQPNVEITEGKGRTKPHADYAAKSGGYYARMLDAEKELNDLWAGKDKISGTTDDVDPNTVYNWKEFAKQKTPVVGNAMNSANFQRALQAQRNWVTANLRPESGAAIPPEELQQEMEKFFPVMGDNQLVVEQKARARKQTQANMKAQSQGAYDALHSQVNKERRSGEKNNGWSLEKVN